MSGKPLHVQVAEALGWTCVGEGECGWEGEPPKGYPDPVPSRRLDQHLGIPRYDADWSTTGPLIGKYKIAAFFDPAAKEWEVRDDGERKDCPACGHNRLKITYEHGSTPLIAVCNLILSLKEAGKL